MFGIILPSRPVLGPAALQTVTPTQFAYTFPAAPPFSHIVVFLLPDQTLPPDAVAGIYLRLPGAADFTLLGGLSAEKQTAIFRVRLGARQQQQQGGHVVGEVNGVAEVDMDAEDDGGGGAGGAAGDAAAGEVTVGISVEPAAQLGPQIAALQQQQASKPGAAAGGGGASGTGASQVPTKVLAQRIIKNAFNFLSGFSGGDGKVPLKSFEDWWKKFERRVENDPSFLEKDQD